MGHMHHASFISTVRMRIPHVALVKLLETSIVSFIIREKSSYHAETSRRTNSPATPDVSVTQLTRLTAEVLRLHLASRHLMTTGAKAVMAQRLHDAIHTTPVLQQQSDTAGIRPNLSAANSHSTTTTVPTATIIAATTNCYRAVGGFISITASNITAAIERFACADATNCIVADCIIATNNCQFYRPCTVI